MIQVKERPILFSGPMAQGILADRKSKTRRLVKRADGELPLDFHDGMFWFADGDTYAMDCPYGAPGERLWVREAYLPDPPADGTWADVQWHGCPSTRQLSDIPERFRKPEHVIYKAGWDGIDLRWKHGMFMPRWASRILLEITDVRVERLQEISEEDAIAEGIEPLFTPQIAASRPEFDLRPMPWRNYLWHGHVGETITAQQSDAWPYQYSSYKDPRLSFSSLWDSINGKKHSWESNPWVWVIGFRRLE